VLGLLVDLEPVQATLLSKICAGPLISADELATTAALAVPAQANANVGKSRGPECLATSIEAEADGRLAT
jgi:hypothetical protein